MSLRWNDALAVGIRNIDLQHQELIELINALALADDHGHRDIAIDEVLPRLTAYVLFHFGTEEALLPSVSSAHAELHRRQHREFSEHIARLRESPPDAIDLPALVAYLRGWLVDHIMRTDHDLADLLRAKSA